jgi:asparagine synthase (glutamine-hydrolysing)
MCGIAGFFSPESRASEAERMRLAIAMGDAIAHRGPDGAGVWVDTQLGVAFAHRRLAIVDLSVHGRQPMISASGRYVITYNGEIYNFEELRRRVAADAPGSPAWRGHSDTEVLLAACDRWGIEEALRLANGMFALAIVDRQERCLVLARDRMGEKPLYYGWQRGSFLFASELKSLRRHPDFERRIERGALPLYMRFGYVPAPWSIYSGIRKLGPGELLRLRLDGSRNEATTRYWSLPLPRADSTMTVAAATEQLDSLLRDAVRTRLYSDVPVGAFLSGGVDSSTVAALMQVQTARPIHTYSIGFHERALDESEHARAVAAVLGTAHTELHVSAEDALAVVPLLAQMYDEPFSDSSQIPTHLLAKLTRQHVTVALSGDGGDELFGGYVRYRQGRGLQRAYRFVPRTLRLAGARMLGAAAGPGWDALLRLAPRSLAVRLSAERMFKLSEVVALEDHRGMYKRLASQWPEPSALVPSIPEPATLLDDAAVAAAAPDAIDWMMYLDQRTYLPDDILVKVDRASMAVALEVRVPFLDPRVVEFAARLPQELKLRDGDTKWLLKQVLRKYVDLPLFDRPKQGFAVPLASWLRGPLREWAEALLAPDALRASGLLDPAPIRTAWQDHLSGRHNRHHSLWTVLMFQDWQRRERAAGSGG